MSCPWRNSLFLIQRKSITDHAKAGNVGAEHWLRFIDEEETCRVEIELTVDPVLTTLQKIGALLLRCMCGLFECPAVLSQPDIKTAAANGNSPLLASRRTISLSVTSFASSIMPKIIAESSGHIPSDQITSRSKGIRIPAATKSSKRSRVQWTCSNFRLCQL